MASDGIAGFDMPGPQPATITLSEAERQGLQQLIRRHSTPQQIALRARIILLAAAGQNHAQIAQTLNISIDMARLWRRRWLALQPISLEDLSVAERFDDLPRPGTPPRLTADQICQIERLACEKPEQSQRPTLAPHLHHRQVRVARTWSRRRQASRASAGQPMDWPGRVACR